MIWNPQVGGFAFERVDLSPTVCRRLEVGSSIDKLYPIAQHAGKLPPLKRQVCNHAHGSGAYVNLTGADSALSPPARPGLLNWLLAAADRQRGRFWLHFGGEPGHC
jgi:hypothetical protein